jgi:hypothetical protein
VYANSLTEAMVRCRARLLLSSRAGGKLPPQKLIEPAVKLPPQQKLIEWRYRSLDYERAAVSRSQSRPRAG